ncbi:retrovirus-related pol polyprotein from transposon TNT 1-94 [Tanacetum coccineum]
MKAEALKEQNTRPIKALTVKPCIKRITPTGITEGERGFEQTKTCYLTEVIPFFKTLQEHFEGIQKALTKEVKEMSDAFDELEAELDARERERTPKMMDSSEHIGLGGVRFRQAHEDFVKCVRSCGTCRLHGNDHFRVHYSGYELMFDGKSILRFRKHSCYVRDTDGVELLKGSRGSNLYTISVEDMMKSSPICLLSKASKNKSWLWHRRLNHLNFGTINDLARKDLVRGLPRLKFEKDHLCSACQLGKSKKHTHKPKTENTNLEVLNTLHMDLCGPMRVQTINGKKYILVIVDDYSRFTWVKFLRSKDETPTVVIKFLKQIQVGLNKTVRFIRTDNGTEFVNKTLYDYYESVGIFHQKTVPRTPQQNGVVERRN